MVACLLTRPGGGGGVVALLRRHLKERGHLQNIFPFTLLTMWTDVRVLIEPWEQNQLANISSIWGNEKL
jgi:hypothetical protein